MKNIQLKRLELTNYRNIEYAVYDFDGDSRIVGENRIGKTNTLEAIYYLLTDKLLDGSTEVSAIKPLKDTKLEVRVKGTFDIDGKEVTLEKDYKENWVKTRGTTNIEMKGHTVTLIHNGVKQSTLKAYNQLVAEDFGFEQDAKTKVDFMQMLINPFYLGNMGESGGWTDLRAFIINLVGDVSDEDVANSKPELKSVKADLDAIGGKVDQLKKKYAGEIDGLKTTIASDDSKIEMLESTPKPTEDEVAVAKKGIQEHQEKIDALKSKNGTDVASYAIERKVFEKIAQVHELEKQDMIKAQADSGKKKVVDEINTVTVEQNKILSEKDSIRRNILDLEWQQRSKERELNSCSGTREILIRQLMDLDAAISNPVIDKECPHCHRPYEEGQIESAKAALIESTQKRKADLIEQGKKVKEQMINIEKDINTIKGSIEEQNKKLETFEKDLDETSKKLSELNEKLNACTTEIEPNPEIATLKEEIEKLKEDFRVSKENYSKGIQDNQQLIYDEEQAMAPFKNVLADWDFYLRQKEQLEVCRKERTDHSKQLADVEQKKELLNLFIFTKLKMLDENVSKVFGNIKFQLIKENINGGFDTICKPYIFDTLKDESSTTSWRSGSKSERLVTGIAIAEKIKQALNLPNLPFLFDEGGEVSLDTFSNRIKTDSQLICVKIADNIQSPLIQKL